MSVLVVLKTCRMLVLICSSILLVSFVKGVDVMLCAIVILSLSLFLVGGCHTGEVMAFIILITREQSSMVNGTVPWDLVTKFD